MVHRAAFAALAALGLLYIVLAAGPAVDGSRIVLATAGGSPNWLLGPFQPFGLDLFSGGNAGRTYYMLLLAAMAAYLVVCWAADRISDRLVIGSIALAHLLFLLAPPLLSQDVFSYIAYARLGADHGLNPYAFRPFDIPGDAVFAFAGSKDAVNVYGPFFTLASYPLAKLSVPAAFWVLKAVATAASLGIVWLVWRVAPRFGVDRRRAAVIVGLSPITLVHIVGGAHNEAVTMLLVVAAIAFVVSARPVASGAAVAVAVAVKASAALAAPFLFAGSRERGRLVAGGLAIGAIALIVAWIGFGNNALDGFGLISSNQDRTSRYSVPHKFADSMSAISGGSFEQWVDAARVVLAVLLLAVLAFLFFKSMRAPRGSLSFVGHTGWATVAVLFATAWLVPWYLLWLLPLAALAGDQKLLVVTQVLSAYTLAIAIPF